MRTPENLVRHELIGLEAEVLDSSDEGLVEIEGEVLDETKSMLDIGGKKVEKAICRFVFELPSGKSVEVDGGLIDRRPAERVGMKLPDRWGCIE